MEAYDRCHQALIKAQLNQPEVSSEEVDSLREKLAAKTEELEQFTASVSESLETQEESDQKVQLAAMVMEAEGLICCVEFHLLKSELQPDPEPLLEKVKTLTEKAGKFSGALDDLKRSLKNLTSDLLILGGLAYLPEEILMKIFSQMRDPASVKAVSLVSR